MRLWPRARSTRTTPHGGTRLRRASPPGPASARRRRHGAPGLRPPAHAVRRERLALARDVLHDRDGALTDERDRRRMGAHAVACDAAGGVGGVDEVGGNMMT